MSGSSEYDVAVVGASVAGCTTAALLGRAGAKVALLEQRPDPAAYKTVCTHFIQASATPTIERLGLAERIETAGGIRNSVQIWTRYGWIRPDLDDDYRHPRYGYDLRREKLDPMLRELASDTTGSPAATAASASFRPGSWSPRMGATPPWPGWRASAREPCPTAASPTSPTTATSRCRPGTRR